MIIHYYSCHRTFLSYNSLTQLMKNTIGLVLILAAATSLAVAATAIMSPISAHAAQPQYCFSNGDGSGKTCFSSKEQCERAATHDQQCKKNRA